MLFNKFEDKTYSAFSAANDTQVLAIDIKVTSGQTFVLSHFANFVDDAAAWGAILWEIYVDGVPVRDFSAIYDQLGAVNLPRELPFGLITAQRDLKIYITNKTLYTDGVTANGSTFKPGVSIKGAYVTND